MLLSSVKKIQIKKRANTGFTLTELAIVLGVIGLILGAIWVAAAHAYQNHKVSKAASEALVILNNYKGLWGLHGIDVGIGASWTDVTCLGVHNGFFLNDMITGACTPSGALPQYSGNAPVTDGYPQSPWGGNSFVWVQTLQSSNAIDIGFANLSQSACISLAAALYGSNTFIFQNIYSATGGAGNGNSGTPWTTAQIDGFCNPAGGNYVEMAISAK